MANLTSSSSSQNAPLARTNCVQRWQQASVNAIIVSLWLWLYMPIFDYLQVIFQREDFRMNQIVLGGVLALIVMQLRREGVRPQPDSPPHWHGLPLILALGSSAVYLLVERFLDINMLSATLFALASYGLLGLWLSPARWRQGLPAMLLLIGVLPFGEHLQTFVGYPMRIFTAELVRKGLAAAGVSTVGVDTILVFENSVSQVDLPCSGVKSLWTGMLFLLAATWVEARPLNQRWFLVVLLFIPLLFVANVGRVAALVLVGQVMGWQLLAEMLHVPLGVLAFVAVCATAVVLLRQQGEPRLPQRDQRLEDDHLKSPSRLPLVLIITILVMIQLYAARPQTGLASTPPAWAFPAGLQTEPLPLKIDENEWLTRDGAEAADRLRFQWGDIGGTAILISSKTWRAHHRPERCFEVYGLTLDDSRAHLVTPDFPVRFVALGDGDQRSLYTATYWFQSATRTTDDYGSRIWADVSLQRERWVLVSVLFDKEVNPHDDDVTQLYLALHETVANYLTH